MGFLALHGLWATDEIKVQIINDNLAWIYYKKYVVNAEIHREVVRVGLIDRWKGITLESKVNSHILKLKDKLELDNEKIRKHKAMESKFNN